MSLETVDLPGVEILAAGGPVHGHGSDAGGDHYTRHDLEALADAHKALAGELQPAAKIGHDTDSPTVGWLENVRVNEDGSRLLADVRQVPKRFAELVKAGAYRTRSIELSRVTSQRSGRVYENVVTGLAWLGGKMPAVRTLADVVKLYDDAGDGVELRRVYSFDEPAAPDVYRLAAEAVERGDITLARSMELLVEHAKNPGAVVRELGQADEAARQAVARQYGLDVDDVPASVAAATTAEAVDLAERNAIARQYGLALEDVA